MEDAAVRAVRKCERRTPALSGLGKGWFVRGVVEKRVGGIRRYGRDCLALAEYRRGDDESPAGAGIRWCKPDGLGGNGSKRHLLVDGRGVPLSLVVTGANRHDVSQLGAVLEKIIVKRPTPTKRRSKHLCADAEYTGEPALQLIERHGYIPHVKGRGQEKMELKRDPNKRARRWVVEVAHTWFTASASCWCVMKSWNAASSA